MFHEVHECEQALPIKFTLLCHGLRLRLRLSLRLLNSHLILHSKRWRWPGWFG